MRRAVLILISTAGLALVGPAATAQPRAPEITVVLGQDIEPYRQTPAGFQRAFARRRPAPVYRVVVLPGREGSTASLFPTTGHRPDLVLAIGEAAAHAVRAQEVHDPLVLADVLEPQRELATGASRRPPAAVGMEIPFAQQFETLRTVAPKARKVGTLCGPATRALVAPATAAAKEAGLTLTVVEIGSVQELPQALAGLLATVDALWALPDATVFSPETVPYIILETLRRRVPFMGLSQNFVKAGSLVGLYPDFTDIGLQAATLAGEILDGRRPEGGPFVHPRKALLAINLRVADVIGFSIPAEIRRRANSVFE